MTLAQMADLITDEMGLYDATSVDLAKRFLRKEFQTLWDKYPWIDTQMLVTVIASAGLSDVPYPAGMDRVITVRASNINSTIPADPFPESPSSLLFTRSDGRFLDPVTSTFLIETDPTMFERTGFTVYYEENTDPVTGAKTLRLYPTPKTDTELLIIGKAVCPGLLTDDSTTIIRNLDPCLIAYGFFDMLQRQRQYAKADVKRKEAQELEGVAQSVEQQQANRPRATKATTVAGNSLAEMTDAVCMICGQWTPDYRLIIREFLRRNYQAMYDQFLWPESLVMVRVPYTTEQVIMPYYVDKVLGIRGTHDTRLFPADSALFLDIMPSAFEELGDPVGYTTLTPVGVSTLPITLSRLTFASTSPVDTGKVFIRGEIISTGQELEEEILLNGTTFVESVNNYDIPITVAKDVTVGDVTVNSSVDGLSLEVIPANRRELKHQRIWFLPIPDSSTLAGGEFFTCLVLGKRAINPLVTDQDTPIITGVQQVLISAAAGDLFRKLGNTDQATAMLQKASASVEVLKAKNMDQAASSPRFVPQVEPHAYISHGVGGCLW